MPRIEAEAVSEGRLSSMNGPFPGNSRGLSLRLNTAMNIEAVIIISGLIGDIPATAVIPDIILTTDITLITDIISALKCTMFPANGFGMNIGTTMSGCPAITNEFGKSKNHDVWF